MLYELLDYSMIANFSVRLYEPHYTSQMAKIAAESSWALLPVANRPLLCHWLDSLSALGLRRVEVFLYQNQREVQDHIGTGEAWGIEIAYHSSPEESTAQINLDMSIWSPFEQLGVLIASTAKKGILMAEKGGLVGFANFAGNVLSQVDLPPSGVTVLHTPEDYLAANFAAMFRSSRIEDKLPVTGYGTFQPSTCKVLDPVVIGNHTILESDTVIGPNVIIGEGSRIGQGSLLENCVILPHTVIAPKSVIREKIISPNHEIQCGEQKVPANGDGQELGSIRRILRRLIS